MQRCPNCRRPIDPGDSVCSFCDQPLNKNQNSQATTRQQGSQQHSDQGSRPHQEGRNKTRSSQTGNSRNQAAPNPEKNGDSQRKNNRSTQSSHHNHTNSRGDQQSNHSAQQGRSQSSGSQTGSNQRNQGKSTQKTTSPSTKSNAFDTSNNTPSGKVNINSAGWWIGWRPLPVILSGVGTFLLLALIVGPGIEIIAGATVVGAVLGLGVYYWGTAVVNNNYAMLRDNFFERSRGRAEDKSGLTVSDYSESYSLRVRVGNSPPFVKPSERYEANYGFLTDVSFDLDKGNIYSMKSRAESQSGTQRQVFYDNMEDIKINDRGGRTQIVILTSAGEDVRFGSGDQQKAEALQRDLRKKLRKMKRQASDHQSV